MALQSSRRIRKIWRLQTERGAYCLKRSILDLRDLIFVQSATEHLLASGFTAILPYVPSLDGRESVEIGGEVFVLFPWLDSREADLTIPADLGLAGRVLADLRERSKACASMTPAIPWMSGNRWSFIPTCSGPRIFGRSACSISSRNCRGARTGLRTPCAARLKTAPNARPFWSGTPRSTWGITGKIRNSLE